MIGGMLTPTRFSSALDVDLLSTLFFNYLQFIYFQKGLSRIRKTGLLFVWFFFWFFSLETAPLMAVWGIAAHLCSSKSMDTIGAVSGE